MAKSYQNINTLKSVIEGYVNDLAVFQGDVWGDYAVEASDIDSRVLQLAIPQQQTALNLGF